MAEPASPDNIVADRYLVSPTALAGNPSGPVDALDTHSGRASQVRLVFLTGAWEEDELSEAIGRWRGIACGEVCGVLDFGRHRGHWYLALPPSLGVPVVRWRAMRLPGPADAARLVLGFGRLVERVAAAGFEPELAGVDDFAVGPGPTPFLERPLLPLPGALPPAPPGGGQRMLARLLDALVARRDIPDGLRGWAERSARGGFGSLAACLDDLERVGSDAATAADADPPGLRGIFDDRELDEMERAAARVPGRWRRIAALALSALVAALAGLALVNPVADSAGRRPAARRPATLPVTRLAAPAAATPHRAGHAPSRQRHHSRPTPSRRGRRHPHRSHGPASNSPTTTSASPTTTSAPAPTPVATSPASTSETGPTVLPAPGGTTLPAP